MSNYHEKFEETLAQLQGWADRTGGRFALHIAVENQGNFAARCSENDAADFIYQIVEHYGEKAIRVVNRKLRDERRASSNLNAPVPGRSQLQVEIAEAVRPILDKYEKEFDTSYYLYVDEPDAASAMVICALDSAQVTEIITDFGRRLSPLVIINAAEALALEHPNGPLKVQHEDNILDDQLIS